MEDAPTSTHNRAMRDICTAETSPDHNSPLIQKMASYSVTALPTDQSSSDKSASSNRYWPQYPQPLKKYHGWGSILLLVIYAVVELLPVLFIFVACAALHLNGTPRSTFGDRLTEGTKYGTTAFPIVFAAIIGRLLRTIALRKCESGVKLGLLEQLMGSQSLAGTIDRFFSLRRYDITGAFLLLVWVLSPFGSQMTLRLLELRSSYSSITRSFQYLNTSTFNADRSAGGAGSSFETGNRLLDDQAVLSSLMAASVLSSQAVDNSPVDTWNNVKIPLFDDESLDDGEQVEGWIQVHQNSNQSWVSLTGIMLVGLPTEGLSTFSLESSHMVAHCPNSIRLNNTNLEQSLRDSGIELTFINASDPFVSFGNRGTSSSVFLDVNSLHQNKTTVGYSLVFGSGNSLARNWSGIDVFDCFLTSTSLESNVSCSGSSCGVTQVRRSLKYRRPPSDMLFDDNTYINILGFIPGSLGYPRETLTSAIDSYLQGADNPYYITRGNLFNPNGYANISGSLFGQRLTTVLNTAYQTSLCPYGTALGSNANFTTCQFFQGITPVANGTAKVILEHPNAIYATNRWHAIMLLVISLLLQLAAFVTAVVSAATRAPNILGFVSSLTRDNPHMANVVPAGGSTLDGAERARALGDLQVRLADLRPGYDVGKIVFMGVDDGSKGQTGGKLAGGGRVYE